MEQRRPSNNSLGNSLVYPKPQNTGGTLIRAVVQSLKESKIKLPIRSPILIATSAGVDSMSLAHLLLKYGRRVAPASKITLLHFDHQWRPESSLEEKRIVNDLALQYGAGFKHLQLPSPQTNPESKNWEDDARKKRVRVFRELAGKGKAYRWVFTGHHANDVVETLVWRFFRGEFLHQQAGILSKDDQVLRVLLKVTKEQLRQYALEESVPFLEDPTNLDPNQMRAQLRAEIFPQIQKVFPGFQNTVLRYSQAKKSSKKR